MDKKRGVMSFSFFGLFSRKSQASIFMVVSLVIILGGLYYFYQQKKSLQMQEDIVNPQIAPVKSYVEDCIRSIAKDGLDIVGQTGGYITIPEDITSNKRSYLELAQGFLVPYWWHDGISSIPTRDFIRQQLEAYVSSELKNCIGSFSPFLERFEISERKSPVVAIKLNEDDVSVNLDYLLSISSMDGKTKETLQNFKVLLPVRFNKVYGLAKTIMEKQDKNYFFEKKTIDLFSMDPAIPTTDIEATCSPKTWRLNDIKTELMKILSINLPYVKIDGTSYNPNLYVPTPDGKNTYSQSYYGQHYLWDIINNTGTYKDTKVSFSYDNWPISMQARPSENGILHSNSQKGTQMLSFFCMHTWHFTYDIGYPVIATIYDRKSNENSVYKFTFAFRVLIDHNQPSHENTGTATFDTEQEISSDDYCKEQQNEITVFTVNNATGDGINGVNLTFACGRFYCNMGQSSYLGFGAASGIEKRFPYCVNGVIRGKREGFLDSVSFLQTDVDGKSLVLALNPLKHFRQFKVVQHPIANLAQTTDLSPNERATILLKGADIGYENFIVYPDVQEFQIPDRQASYDISIYLSDNESINGGYIGSWNVSRDDLGKNEITFHVLEQNQDSSEDQRASFISTLGTYSKIVPAIT